MNAIFKFFFLAFFFISKTSFSQINHYKVVYEGVISTSELLKGFDSLHVIGNNTDKDKIPISSVPAMDMSVMKLEVLVVNERVVVKRLEHANVKDTSGKSSDSTVFENGAWYNYKDGKAVLKSSFTGDIIKTAEKKVIHGYDCIKYIWDVPLHKRTTELWIAKALPFTISPFTVRVPVEGAILESKQLGSNFIFKVIDFKKDSL